MSILNTIKKCKALLSSVKLTQETTDGGLVIQYDGDALEVGVVVYVQNEAGDWAVLPDADYVLESGTKFTVFEGIVTSVEQPTTEAKVEETATVEASAETVVEEKVTPTVDEIVDQKLAPVLAALEAIKTQLSAHTENLNKTQSALSTVSDTVVLLSKQPAATPAQSEVNAFRKPSKDITESRAYQIMNSK
jgi:hypothetical protein